VFNYVAQGVGGYWFSENMTLANRVSGAWWIWKGAEEEESRAAYGVL